MTERNSNATAYHRRDLMALMLGAGAGSLLAPISFAYAQAKVPAPLAKPRGQVIAGISQEPTVFNPLMPGSEVDQGVWWQLFSPLWFIAPDG